MEWKLQRIASGDPAAGHQPDQRSRNEIVNSPSEPDAGDSTLISHSRSIERYKQFEDETKREVQSADTHLEWLIDAIIGLVFFCAISLIFCIHLLPADKWLAPMPGMFLTAASLTLVAAAAARAHKQFLISQRQSNIQTLQLLLRYRELAEQEHVKAVDQALNGRLSILEREADAHDLALDQESRVRTGVQRYLNWITPYITSSQDAATFKEACRQTLNATDIVASEYIQQLLGIFQIAGRSIVQLKDSAVIDHVWARLFPQEQLICMIMRAGGHLIVLPPSAGQLALSVQAICRSAPWPLSVPIVEAVLRDD